MNSQYFLPASQQVQFLDDPVFDIWAEGGCEQSEAVSCYKNAAIGGVFCEQMGGLLQLSVSRSPILGFNSD